MGVRSAVLDRMMASSVRHVKAVRTPPPGLAADVYAAMRSESGLLPPFICLASNPEVLAAVWVAGREAWLAGPVRRIDREVVAAGVSRANECPFCVEAHTMTQRVARADPERDPRLGAIDAWAASTLRPDALPDPPFGPDEAPWMIGTAVAFHTINRIVNVLLSESGVPAPMRVFGKVADRVGDALVGKPMLELNPEPGGALDLLPPAAHPADLHWASADPVVTEAFARADAALDRASSALPADVRALVAERVSEWRGQAPGLSRSWAEEAAAALDPPDRPAAVLGLLVALASYQVDDGVVAAYRDVEPSDGALVAAVAWPAWQAARRVGAWLVP